MSGKKTKDLSKLAVDAVLCISLKNREDRRAAIEKEFAACGREIEFFLADKDQENPERGCYNSHLACARIAVARGYERVLILEDDAIIDPFRPETILRINRFLESANPEIFYLGAVLGKMWLTRHRNIARIRGQATHAYILSAQGCAKVAGWEAYFGRGIDNLYSKRFKGYGVFPMICFQNDQLASDIRPFRSSTEGEIQFDRLQQHRRKQYIKVFQGIGKTLIGR